jgi:hypothetical protein
MKTKYFGMPGEPGTDKMPPAEAEIPGDLVQGDDIADSVSVATSALLNLERKAEYVHLEAGNLNRHEIAGELRELIYRLADDSFEACAGSGHNPYEIAAATDIADGLSTAEEVAASAAGIAAGLADLGIPAIKKLADDFAADVAKISYKLNLC